MTAVKPVRRSRRWLTALAMLLIVVAGAGVFLYRRPLTVIGWYGSYQLWRAGVHSHNVTLDGVRVHYIESGTGPTLVLVHGLGGSSEIDWGNSIVQLSRKYRVLALDLPGFGKSDKPENLSYSIRMQEDYLVRFLDALNVKKAHLMGVSMGGWVVAKTTIDHPERVERLVLVDSAGVRFDPLPTVEMLTPGENEADLESFMRLIFFKPPKFPAPIARDFINRAREGEWVIRKTAAAMFSMDDVLDGKLGRITAPTLILWGKQDALLPLLSGEKFQAEMPDANFVVFDNCGHVPNQERNPAFLKEVETFLSAPQPPKGGFAFVP
jgi:pimeloyl-ACP methyl ester carboxylesterase